MLCYVKILGLSYLHVKFHHAEGIFTTYIDHSTFPPNYVRPVTLNSLINKRMSSDQQGSVIVKEVNAELGNEKINPG